MRLFFQPNIKHGITKIKSELNQNTLIFNVSLIVPFVCVSSLFDIVRKNTLQCCFKNMEVCSIKKSLCLSPKLFLHIHHTHTHTYA